MAEPPKPQPRFICHKKLADGTECGGPLKKVHLSNKKWRTTKCLKCGKIWMVRGDKE